MTMENPGGIREVFRIRHVERVRTPRGVPTATVDALKPSTSGRPEGVGPPGVIPPVRHPSAIGRRLYAVLEDTVRRRQIETAEELLVVVGHSRSNIVVRVWDVSVGPSDDIVSPPSLIAHRVFKALKLLESEIESVAVATSEWPKVFVAVGTASGAIHVYCCADIGVEGVGGDDFSLLTTVDALKDKRGQAAGGGGPKTNRVHHVSFVRGSGPECGSGVWGASEKGDVIGFRSKGGGIVVLDEVKGPVKRGCVSQDEHGVLSLVTRDGIFCYSMGEGRTGATPLQGGEKQAAFAVADGYLVIIGGEWDQTGPRAAEPIGTTRPVRFQVVDLGRKIVACSTSLPGPIRVAHARSSRGPLASSESPSGLALHMYVFDGAGRVHRMSELPFETQVEELCKAKMFPQALNLCERERARCRSLATDDKDCMIMAARVHLLFGDHLYQQGNPEAAVDAYINTIGFVETSHVIQTFLQGTGDVGQLARYLVELFNSSQATGDHISLLMQVYVDANESSHIDELVNQLCLRRGKLAASLDATTAIGVLRRAGLVQHALDIAESYGRDEQYVSILMDDRLANDEVLEYLKTRPRGFAAAQLLRHGTVLIKDGGSATTRLLLDLCTPPDPGNGDPYVADLANFLPLYVNGPKGPNTHDLQRLCEQVILSSKHTNASAGVSLDIIYHSLLDAYLVDDKGHDSSGAPQSTGDAVMDLLRRGWPPGHDPAYDPDVVLTRCAARGHLKGVAFVHARRRRYRDAVLTLADARDWQGVVDLCIKHGRSYDGGDPCLWRVALEAMVVDAAGGTADDDRVADVHTHLESLLAAIGDAGAMAPLSVLDMLAKNPSLPFGVAKDYFVDTLQGDLACINASSADIALLTKKIEATKESLEQLDAHPATFKATRDSATGSNLHVPAIHFMCGHSFNAFDLDRHQQGPGKNQTMPTTGAVPACPLCVEGQERARTLLQNSKMTSRARDAFYRRLRGAEEFDGFVEISATHFK